MANSGTELLEETTVIWTPMAKYEVGFDGRWQGAFDDREQAVQWAQKVAETGRVVDVVLKRDSCLASS